MFKSFWENKARTMDARLIILLLLIFPIATIFIFPYRSEISEKSRARMTYISMAWTVIMAVGFSAAAFDDHFKPQPEEQIIAQITTEAPTTTRRRSTTTTRQTTTATESSPTTEETTSASDTSTEAADSTAETTTESTAETTTATTRATTAPPTEPVYTEPPAIQTQTQVVYKDYLYNSNSGIFHSSGCRTIPDNMGDHWIAYYSTTSDYMRSLGYKPCGTCKP